MQARSKLLPFCSQVENITISLELISVIKSTMTIQDVAFIWDENMPKKGNFRCDYKQFVQMLGIMFHLLLGYI